MAYAWLYHEAMKLDRLLRYKWYAEGPEVCKEIKIRYPLLQEIVAWEAATAALAYFSSKSSYMDQGPRQ